MWALRASLLAAAAGVLGCAASAPPPPSYAVRSGDARVTIRWEQFCEQATSVQQASWLASSRGADGWELVGMYNGVLCYKRPEPVRSPPFAPPPQMVAPGPPAAPYGPVTGAAQSTVPKIIDPGF